MSDFGGNGGRVTRGLRGGERVWGGRELFLRRVSRLEEMKRRSIRREEEENTGVSLGE